MFSEVVIKLMTGTLVQYGIDLLLPAMAFGFAIAAALRVLIFFTVKRHEWFSKEFEKRVSRFLEFEDTGKESSFYVMTKRLLEKTFYELFEVRDRLKRRKPDMVMSLSDRLFLIRQGTAWIVRDTLKQIKHLKRNENQPRLLNITKGTFMHNPCFNKVFGVIPSETVNDVLNILPGLFVIGGIFGTFLGIVKGLPTLGGMKIEDAEQTKLIMDRFLGEISFAMYTSIIGIILSVAMSVLNTVFSPEKVFVQVVDRFENSLDLLWHRSNNNSLPRDIANFDEHRDAVEALAEQSLHTELSKNKEIRKLDVAPPGTKDVA